MPVYDVTEVTLKLKDCRDDYSSLAEKIRRLSQDIRVDESFTVDGGKNDLYVSMRMNDVNRHFGSIKYFHLNGQLLAMDDSLVPRSLEGAVRDVVIADFKTKQRG